MHESGRPEKSGGSGTPPRPTSPRHFHEREGGKTEEMVFPVKAGHTGGGPRL